MDEIEMRTPTFEAVIRAQKGLTVTDAEAEAIDRALETCHDDDECLAAVLSAVRRLADRLDDHPRL